MNLFTIENLFIAILSLALSLIIYKYARNLTQRIWALFNLSVALWAFCIFLVGIATNEKQALFYWKYAFVGVALLGTLFYHFVLSYCKLNRPFVLVGTYIYALTFSSLTAFTNKVMTKAPLMFGIYFERDNTLFTVFFIMWICIVVMGFVEFFYYMKRSTGLQLVQDKFMFWSVMVGFLGGVSTALPGYGLHVYPGFQILIIFYIVFTSYAIFKHGALMPLDVVIKRNIYYSSLATSVTIIYFTGVLIFGEIFKNWVGHENWAGSVLPLIVIAIIFIPLKHKIQSKVDRIILKSSPLEMAIQNENLRSEVAQTEKFKIIAKLASMLAHEIKNPLGALLILTEQLKLHKDDPGFIDQYESLVTQEIGRINSLIQDLLQLSKPSVLQIKEINPNEVLDQILKFFETRCEKSNIRIIRHLETKKNIRGDFNLLKQSMLNLVLNAIEAMPDGGELRISTKMMRHRFSRRLEYWIEISDTGCGIDPKDLSLVFEPFYTRKKSGTGLGLPITQGIIEKHGGRIEINSKLNKGTIFNIYLNVN